MPFDAAGNFSRSYNFTQDRDNGIKILASHVDGEFDNFATGMNAVFFRDGRVPMQADLRLNINGITGLKDGALGSPAIKFNTDANTGVYMPGLNQFGIQVNAIQRGVFTTAGFDVTGNGTYSGTLSVTGAIVEGGTALTAKYAQLASPTFTGVPAAPTAAGGTNTTQLATTAFVQGAVAGYLPLTGGTLSGGLTAPTLTANGVNAALFLNCRDASPNGSVLYSPSSNTYNVFMNSAVQFSLTPSAATFTPGVLNVGGTNKLLMQHNGTDGFVRSEINSLYLGAQGVNGLQLDGAGKISSIATNGYFYGTGAGNSYNAQYSASRNGRVGYHLYNNGASTEWIIYQPAPGVGHDLRISMGAAGGFNDRCIFATDGNMYPKGSVGVEGELWVGGTSGVGVIRFGAQASGPKFLYYDGSLFQLSAGLNVGGNITSSSDARLKSNVRDFENGLAIVKALRPKRFDMHGKADFGFVAQELQRVLPEAVIPDAKGMLGVDYGRLTAPLAAAIQSLSDRLDRAGL